MRGVISPDRLSTRRFERHSQRDLRVKGTCIGDVDVIGLLHRGRMSTGRNRQRNFELVHSPR